MVSEPEPGRVLVEKQTDGSVVTTFTITLLGDNRSRVTITTDYEASGAMGFFETLMVPRVLRGVYEKELRQLEQFVVQSVTTTV